MAGKRKRGHGAVTHAIAITDGKPLTAVAAARLKAEAAKKGLEPQVTRIPSSVPPVVEPGLLTVSAHGLLPEPAEPESDEEPSVVQQNFRLCSWRNEAQNIVSDTDSELTVRLHKHTTISLVGCFRFKVLKGAVNINGANIGVYSRHGQQHQAYAVFAPATHLVSKIRGLDGANQVQFLNCEGPTPLESINPVFSNIWSGTTGRPGNRSFSVVMESSADELARPLVPETTPEDWLRAIEDCASIPSTTFIVGPAACGKSTFGRRLLNRYLTGQGKSARAAPSVCFLDLDPLNPEYAPPGQISLTLVQLLNLGPAFTHPAASSSSPGSEHNQMIRSHAIPLSLANYSDYYRACAEDLFLTYKSLRSRDPLMALVINTPGSLYSAYMSILLELVMRLKPHHIVHLGDAQAIDSDQATKLDSLHTIVSQYRGTMYEVTAHAPLVASMRSNAELRAMHMQSYFHLKKMSTSDVTPCCWNPNPISTLTPWEFCFEETDERKQDFVGFATYSEPAEPASLFHALNGSVVHIVESTSSAIPSPYTDLPRTRRHRMPYFAKSERTSLVEPLDPKTSKVVCTALVRGFDLEKRVVQVLVPETHGSLIYILSPERTVFVGGCCDSPEWSFVEDAYAGLQLQGSNSSTNHDAEQTPWVEEADRMEGMGYLNTVRRVRKFQT